MKTELEYRAFLQLILPYDTYLRFIAVQKLTYKPPKFVKLTQPLEKLLARLIKKDIEINSRLEKYKLALKNRPDFDAFILFTLIDKEGLNHLNEENVRKYLRGKNHEDVSEMFVKGLDIDMDGKLTHNEFLEGILPYCHKELMPTLKEYPTVTESPINYTKDILLNESEFASELVLSNTTAESNYLSPQYKNNAPCNSASPHGYEYSTPYKRNVDDSKKVLSELPAHSVRSKSKFAYSPVSQTKSKLLSAIREQLKIEAKLKEEKYKLIKQINFNLLDAFRVIDSENRCSVTLTEFKNALKRLGVDAEPDSIESLYRHYNRKCNGKFQYSDFCDLMLPRGLSHTYYSHSKEPSGKLTPMLSQEAMNTFREMLTDSANLEVAKENVRKLLNNSSQFDADPPFIRIGPQGRNYIYLNDVICIT